jgi:hypothetical protein
VIYLLLLLFFLNYIETFGIIDRYSINFFNNKNTNKINKKEMTEAEVDVTPEMIAIEEQQQQQML